MTPTILETMKQALEVLAYYEHRDIEWEYHDDLVITNLRAAIKAMEDAEPVAWFVPDLPEWGVHFDKPTNAAGLTPLYTHPAPTVPEDVAKDAARYRWLRDQEETDDIGIAMKTECINGMLSNAENIDNYIDQAMKD